MSRLALELAAPELAARGQTLISEVAARERLDGVVIALRAAGRLRYFATHPDHREIATLIHQTALADCLATAGWDLNDQAPRRYVRWWRRGEYSVNGRCFTLGSRSDNRRCALAAGILSRIAAHISMRDDRLERELRCPMSGPHGHQASH